MNSRGAIIRFHYGKYATVLCPNGHIVTKIDLGPAFNGSASQAELSKHQLEGGSVYDRLAAACVQQDTEEARARMEKA